MYSLKKQFFWLQLKRTVHILIGIVIGFWLTSQFRSINYETFKKDILYQLCSYRSLQLLQHRSSIINGDDQIFHVSTKTDLAKAFDTVKNITANDQPNTKDSSRRQRRKLLLVGVMTTKSFIETRAATIYETWGQDLQGDLIFFTSSNLKTNTKVPYVALPQVDDSYPPQKKSFFMLKFLYDFFGDRYKFFMRADDDVFVNVDRLKHLLESLNSSEQIYIGQTGVGNKEEFGLLNLNSHDNFCMGGPGVIISFKALEKISKNAANCLNNLYSTHEDVEVGRCLKKFAGVSCTWSYDMQSLFYHNASIQSSILNDIPPSKNLLNALTIHPIKNPMAMKKLYIYFKDTQHQILNFKITKLLRNLNSILPIFNDEDWNFLQNIKTFANIRKLREASRKIGSIIPSVKILLKSSADSTWKYFSQKYYSELSLNPRRNVDRDIIQGFNQNMEQIMVSLNRNSFKKGTLFDYHSLYYGYVKFDRRLGMQYIFDFLMVYRKYQGKRLTLPIRKHVYAMQSFSKNRMLEPIIFNNKQMIVNIIVPLAGRLETFRRFLDNFVEVKKKDQHLTLTVMLFVDDQKNSLIEIENLLNQTVFGKLIPMNGKFSRGQALQKSSELFADDCLLFFLDVDMLFNEDVIDRVRQNTALGRQVYFPIVFSQYSDYLKKLLNDSTNDAVGFHGYWRQFGYGIVSLYKQDLMLVGGYDTTINGWGMEDVNLYDRFITSTNLTIWRSIDPDLIHVYHDIHCDKHLPLLQYEMCLGTKFSSLDSTPAISNFIKSHRFLSD